MNYVEKNNRYFQRSATKYDRNTALLKSSRMRLVELAAPQPGQQVLDVATGTGAMALLFAKQGCAVTGIDLSEDMLKVANGKNTFANLHYMHGDASKLPFEPDSFDITTTSFALHDMPQNVRDAAIAEMIRVTRPGGTIAIMDYHQPENPVWRSLSYRLITLYEELEFRQFIRQNLKIYLQGFGITVTHHETILLSVGQVIIGRNGK